MTDARYPERWLMDRRINRLSDGAHRLFVVALAWSVSNRTDGLLYPDDLEDLPRVDQQLAPELVKAGVWILHHDGWRIAEYDNTQTTAAQLAGLDLARLHERDKKARQRRHNRDDHSLCRPDTCEAVSRDASRDVPGDVWGDTKDRQGQDRQGQASRGEQVEADGNCSECGTPIDPGAWYAHTGRHPGCQVREAS